MAARAEGEEDVLRDRTVAGRHDPRLVELGPRHLLDATVGEHAPHAGVGDLDRGLARLRREHGDAAEGV